MTKADAMQYDEKMSFLLEVKGALEGLKQEPATPFGYYQLDSACYSVAVSEEKKEGKDTKDNRSYANAVPVSPPSPSMETRSPSSGCSFKSAAFRCMGEKLQNDGDMAAASGEDDMIDSSDTLRAGHKTNSNGKETLVEEMLEKKYKGNITYTHDIDDAVDDDSIDDDMSESSVLEPLHNNLKTEMQQDDANGAKSNLSSMFVPDVFALVCHPSLQRKYPVSCPIASTI